MSRQNKNDGKLTREILLKQMLAYDDPRKLPELRRELGNYGWDSEEELVSLTREHIISVLQRYLNGQLTEKEVEEWADALDMRDDIRFGLDEDDDTVLFVSELANPISPITPSLAQKLINEMINRKTS